MLWIYHEYVHARSLQSYLTLGNPMDYSPLGSSLPGILQSRILDWVVIPFSNLLDPGIKQSRVSYVSCIDRQVLYH